MAISFTILLTFSISFAFMPVQETGTSPKSVASHNPSALEITQIDLFTLKG